MSERYAVGSGSTPGLSEGIYSSVACVLTHLMPEEEINYESPRCYLRDEMLPKPQIIRTQVHADVYIRLHTF